MKTLFQKWFVALLAAVIVAGCGASPQGTNISVSDVGNVEGTVTDTSTGVPLSGVTVQIGDKSDVTRDNGVYSIQDIDVGSRTITATNTGYQSYDGTVTVSKGTTVNHNIEMTTLEISADTTPPTVSSTSPTNAATSVALDTSITVTFSEAMDCSTITTTTFTLKDGTNNAVTGTVSTCNGATATFTPSSNLGPNNTYTATITTGVKDADGNIAGGSHTWSFATGSTLVDTTPPIDGTLTATDGIGEISLSWSGFSDASGIASYRLVYSTITYQSSCSTGTEVYSGIDTSYIHTGLIMGTTYYYRICAIDNAGNISSGVTVSVTPQVVWTKQFGTAGDEQANRVSVGVDANGNIYIAGGTWGGLDGNTSAGSQDGFLIKYDPAGVKQWTRQFGTASGDWINGMSVDANGNVYVAGGTEGGLDDNISSGAEDGILVKYNSSGVKQWTRQFGTASTDGAFDVSVDESGNVYVAGYTNGGLDGYTNAGQNDSFLIKYDSSGVKQWTRQFGTANSDWASDVSVDTNGNVYMAGGTEGGLDGNTSAGLGDGFLVKYDSSGLKQWTRQFGTSSDEGDERVDVSIDVNGNIYATGASSGGLDGNTNAGGKDGFLIKYDSSGVRQWTRQFGTASDDWSSSISVDVNGNIYAAGGTYGGLDGNANTGSSDGFLVKYDSSGVKQWTRQFGTTSYDRATGVSIDANGNIYAAGDTSGGLDGNVNAGYSDGFLVKYDANGNKQ